MRDTSKCAGCRNNVYNLEDFGMNRVGKNKFRCWYADAARLIEVRLVPMDMRPPWDGLPVQSKPSCYTTAGYATIPAKKGKGKGRP